MFNPPRKVKVADIYMQEKAYNSHLQKIDQIQRSLSLRSKRYTQETQQQQYYSALTKSKKQIKSRLLTNIQSENKRLRKKLIETESRKEALTPNMQKRKHFNSYFTHKKQRERVNEENYSLAIRMTSQGSDIPALKELKKEYKKNRKLAKNCRKLPAIIRVEESFKTKFSQPAIHKSRTLKLQLKQ